MPTDHGTKPQAEFTDLARLVLERCKTAAEAVATLTEMVSLYGQTCKTCPEAADYNSLFMGARRGEKRTQFLSMRVHVHVHVRARARVGCMCVYWCDTTLSCWLKLQLVECG